MKLISLTILIVGLAACSAGEVDCVDKIAGVYTGKCTTDQGVENGNMVISNLSVFGNMALIIQDNLFLHNIYGGELSANCNSIVIDHELIINVTDTVFVNGVLEIDGKWITGDVTFTQNATAIVCSYEVKKM